MEDEKRPKFTKEYLNSSLFRIGSLVTQGKLSADDFPLRAYTLRMNYTDMHIEAIVVVAESWFLSDRARAEFLAQRYDRSLGALGDMINCTALAADFYGRPPEKREQSQKLVFIGQIRGLNLITPPTNEYFSKRSSKAVNDATVYVAETEKPSLIALSKGVYSDDGGRSWDTDFVKHRGKTAKCMVLNTAHRYALQNGQDAMVFDLTK